MSGSLLAVGAALVIGVIVAGGAWLVRPSWRERQCRVDLGIALLTGALVSSAVVGVQIFFDSRLADLDRQRQEAQEQRDATLSMKLAISSQKDLRGIQLENLDLSRFYFGGKTLTYAQMSGTRLVGAVLDDVDLAYADLSRGDLRRANLRDASLVGALLAEARLDDVIAAGADFSRADLTGAVLRRADLSGAKLQGADLTGADIPFDSLSATEYDAQTRWPAYLRIPKCRVGATCRTK